MTAWRLLLTRPAEECAALETLLAGHRIHGSSLPLLAIEALPETPEQRSRMLDLDRYAAVVVVSKPAARIALERLDTYWPQPPVGPRWFSVGAATGALLQAYGLDARWPSYGDDSEALLALPALHQALAGPEPKLLLLRGEGGREYLAEQLQARGVTVDALALYRRTCPSYASGTLLQRIRAERLNGLVVSSGQGLVSLYTLAGDAWPGQVARLPLFVPSPRVAAEARALGAIEVINCHGASNAALLEALKALPAPAG